LLGCIVEKIKKEPLKSLGTGEIPKDLTYVPTLIQLTKQTRKEMRR
jgi:protein required for attachment to host cells